MRLDDAGSTALPHRLVVCASLLQVHQDRSVSMGHSSWSHEVVRNRCTTVRCASLMSRSVSHRLLRSRVGPGRRLGMGRLGTQESTDVG